MANVKFTDFPEISSQTSNDFVLVGNVTDGVRKILPSNLNNNKVNKVWTKSSTFHVASNVSIDAPVSASEFAVIAIGGGNVYCKIVPNVPSIANSYVVIEYLDADYIRVYFDGNGNALGEKAGFTYDVYYR